MSARVEQIRETLTRNFAPLQLTVEDQSHLHAGHDGARDGRGHFCVRIVAAEFAGLSPLVRHRRIYAALGQMMQTDIHALTIDARAPDETHARFK
ncbi:MAG: BolA family protein [Rudaea sp.]